MHVAVVQVDDGPRNLQGQTVFLKFYDPLYIFYISPNNPYILRMNYLLHSIILSDATRHGLKVKSGT